MYMHVVFTLFIWSIEWMVLLLFPLILLGYHDQRLLKRLILFGLLISIISALLRATMLPIVLIFALQMLVLFFLVVFILGFSYFESLVIASIGYGFYTIVQLLIVEVITLFSIYNYFEIIFSNTEVTVVMELISILMMGSICYILKRQQYDFSELKDQLQSGSLNPKMKMSIIIISLFTFVFICLTSLTVSVEDLSHRSLLLILCITLLFLILSIYFVLHTQIKIKSLMEAKKFHLDKEQQLAHIVEQLRRDATEHYQVIYNLCQRGALPLCLEYIEKHHLHLENLLAVHSEQLEETREMDELLYAFLRNKQKLARLLNVQLVITPAKLETRVLVSLKKIRQLSVLMDELILALYQAPADVDKRIQFSMETINDELNFDITSNITLEEKNEIYLRLLEVLCQFRRENAFVYSSLKPVHVSISYSLT